VVPCDFGRLLWASPIAGSAGIGHPDGLILAVLVGALTLVGLVKRDRWTAGRWRSKPYDAGDVGPPAEGRASDAVAPSNSLESEATRGSGRQITASFKGRDLLRELGVLDHLADPTRVLAPVQMMRPRRPINTLRQLAESQEVRGAQVQGISGTAEIEAAVGRNLPFDVLADMAPMTDPPTGRTKPDRARLGGAQLSEYRFPLPEGALASIEHRVGAVAA
jgi:hypothetical protein